MSYILEALKKSEQERGRGNVPDIKSVHAYVPPTLPTRRTWWPWILVSVVVINAIIFAVVYLGDDPGTTPVQVAELESRSEVDTSAPVASPSAASDTVAAEKKVPATPTPSVAKKPAPVKHAAAKPKPASDPKPRVIFSKTPLEPDDTVGNLDAQVKTEEQQLKTARPGKVKKDVAMLPADLPESVKKQIPNIAFEGHVYSSTISRRSVMINGKKMRQGDTFGGGLVLKEITPLGAEFEYQGYLFKLNALQDWSYR